MYENVGDVQSWPVAVNMSDVIRLNSKTRKPEFIIKYYYS